MWGGTRKKMENLCVARNRKRWRSWSPDARDMQATGRYLPLNIRATFNGKADIMRSNAFSFWRKKPARRAPENWKLVIENNRDFTTLIPIKQRTICAVSSRLCRKEEACHNLLFRSYYYRHYSVSISSNWLYLTSKNLCTNQWFYVWDRRATSCSANLIIF